MHGETVRFDTVGSRIAIFQFVDESLMLTELFRYWR